MERPSAGVINNSVSPNSSRLSHTGTFGPIVAPSGITGTSAVPVTQNGMTEGEWWWQTE